MKAKLCHLCALAFHTTAETASATCPCRLHECGCRSREANSR